MLSRLCCLVSFRILLHELDSDLWLRVSWIFDPRCGLAQPGPAQLGPRALGAPCSPCTPIRLISFPHSILPRSNLLSHRSLSPRGALGFGDGDRRNLDPLGELPSPLLLSLPLPLPPLSFPMCTPFFSTACARPWSPCAWPPDPSRTAPSPPGAAPRPPAARLPRPPAQPSWPPAARLPACNPCPPRRRGSLAPPAQPSWPPAACLPARVSRCPCARPLGPGGAAPRPPARGRPGPGARPLPSAAWFPSAVPVRVPAWLAWPWRGLTPPFTQRVPACAGPRVR